MRTVARAAAAALLIGSLLTAGGLASAAPAQAATPAESAAANIALPPTPYNRSLTATYGTKASDAAAALSVSATSIAVTLPAETEPFGFRPTDVYIIVIGDGKTSIIDLSLAPGGLQANGAIGTGELERLPRLIDADGLPFLRFVVRAETSYPIKLGPPNVYTSGPASASGSILLDGVLAIDDSDRSSDVSIVLDRAGATAFALRTGYWSTPERDVWVHPGGTVTIAGIPATASGVAEARLDARRARPGDDSSRIDLVAHASADGSVLEVDVPAEVDFTAQLAAAGALRLTVSVTDGTDQVVVGADVSAARSSLIAGVESTRISGEDRYAGAYAVAQADFPRTAQTVYFASGEAFPDALSAAPAAVRSGAPVLLGMSQYAAGDDRYRPMVGYVQGFRPGYLKVIGGPASLSPGWDLEFATGGIAYTSRIDGPDRYAVSRRIAMEEFGYSAPTVFITTGVTFPDALSTVPAAVSQKAPIILVNGTAAHLDAETADALRLLRTSEVVIVGGPASVSTGIKADLSDLLGADRVQRIGGDDRYAVAKAVNRRYFAEAPEVYLATGLNFPDALTGGVLAAANGAPLLLARTDCVPGSALDAMKAWGTTRVTLLGGPNSLSTAVLDLQRCP